MFRDTKLRIELQTKINNEWKFYCYLIENANKKGHYGPAANIWNYAKEMIKKHPEEFRIQTYREE